MKKTQVLATVAVLGACLLLVATAVFFLKNPDMPMRDETTDQNAAQGTYDDLAGEFGWESRPTILHQTDMTETECLDTPDSEQEIKEPAGEGTTQTSSDKEVQQQTEPTQTQGSSNSESTVLPSEDEPEATTAGDVSDTTFSEETPETVHLTYDAYVALTSKEQKAYRNSFADEDAFLAWFRMAQDACVNGKTDIEITGPIDMEQIAKEEP